MPLASSPLPNLQASELTSFPRSPSPREHRRRSSEYGWYDVEPMLSSRGRRSSVWDEDACLPQNLEYSSPSGEHHQNKGVLPRALQRVLLWLEQAEGDLSRGKEPGKEGSSFEGSMSLAIVPPSTPVRRDGDEVVVTKSVTKADFSLTTRAQPSLAIGIYAHRVVSRRRWRIWTCYETEYLVILGTDTELLSEWRSYSDFVSLAEATQKMGGVSRSTAVVNVLAPEVQNSGRSPDDPAHLRTEAACLKNFLVCLVEELDEPDIEVLVDFMREPTTYVVIGAETTYVDNGTSSVSNGAIGRRTSSGPAAVGSGARASFGTNTVVDDTASVAGSKRDRDSSSANTRDGVVLNNETAVPSPVGTGEAWMMPTGKRKETPQLAKPEPRFVDGL